MKNTLPDNEPEMTYMSELKKCFIPDRWQIVSRNQQIFNELQKIQLSKNELENLKTIINCQHDASQFIDSTKELENFFTGTNWIPDKSSVDFLFQFNILAQKVFQVKENIPKTIETRFGTVIHFVYSNEYFKYVFTWKNSIAKFINLKKSHLGLQKELYSSLELYGYFN